GAALAGALLFSAARAQETTAPSMAPPASPPVAAAPVLGPALGPTGRQIERLDRGVVAGPALGGGVLVSWRLLATDPAGVVSDVYRGQEKLTRAPLREITSSLAAAARADVQLASYSVRTTFPRQGSRQAPQPPAAAIAAPSGYITIPLTP